MSVEAPARGTAAIPEAEHKIPPTPQEDLDKAIEVLQHNKDSWTATTIRMRIGLLEDLIESTKKATPRWIKAALEAKGIKPGTPPEGEEWIAGPALVIRNLRLLKDTLKSILDKGHPTLPGKPHKRPDGQVVAPVFPTNIFDKLLYDGFSAEVWMMPDVSLDNLKQHQAAIYQKPLSERKGIVCLVLGAGNVSSIGPMDAFYKLFAEDQVVLLKMNPVNEYLGPAFEEALKPLIDLGYLRVVYGGAKEGAYCCSHDGVDEIHITGSDKTHDAIVFGPGEEGKKNKAAGKPKLTKRITSELGNVSPVIIVPGPWTQKDLDFQGQNLASMLTNNAGFNCNATRVIIQHASWNLRQNVLDSIHNVFKSIPNRKAYYPGAQDRYKLFLEAGEKVLTSSQAKEGELPWTIVAGVDSKDENNICFSTEAFCSVTGETGIEAASVVEYIEKAVEFANNRVWGTLNASIIVHPESLKDPAVNAAVEKAIANLRHGCVAVNHWAALGYGFVSTTWGAFPGHDIYDIQSGVGIVHNTYLFERPQKCVIRGPFKLFPKPAWFVTHKTTHEIGPKLVDFEAAPSFAKIPNLLFSAIRG